MPNRLSLLIHSIGNGGTETVLLNLIEAWHADGLDVGLVLAQERPSRDLVPSYVRITVLDAHGPYQWTLKLVQYLRAKSPEMLLAFMAGAGNKALAAARVLVRVPTISTGCMSGLSEIIRDPSHGRLASMEDDQVLARQAEGVAHLRR